MRYNYPIEAWTVSPTLTDASDILQKEVLRFIPEHLIVKKLRGMGVGEFYEKIYVKHVSGGISVITFKSAAQGREKMQGKSVHFVLIDEECPRDIFSECTTRTMTNTNGRVVLTFTPLQGVTDLVLDFTNKADDRATGQIAKHKYLVRVGWKDVPHLTEDQMEQIKAGLMPHEIEARMNGVPTIGQGKIFDMPEDTYVVDDLDREVVLGWPVIAGLDVGHNTTAMCVIRRDDDSGICYVTDVLYLHHLSVPDVALEILQFNKMPIAIDPASGGSSQIDGRQFRTELYNNGVETFPAINSVQAGLARVYNLLKNGELKIFKSCLPLLDEMRQYRRNEKGKLSEPDHAIDALRYGCMSLHGMALPSMVNRKFKPVEAVKFRV